MERWDIYTADRVKTGRTWPRGTELKDGDYHLVVHVCLFNKQGQMLIQQRQPFKEGWPNMWDLSVGGSATAGDTSQTAAERELFEELGLSLSFEGRRPQLTVPFEVGFDDYYLIETEVDLTTLTLQEEEVQTVKWATEDEIITGIREGVFISYHEPLIRLLFILRHQYGAHQK